MMGSEINADVLRKHIICDRCNRAVDRLFVERDYRNFRIMFGVSCHGEHDVMSVCAGDDETLGKIQRGDFAEARAFVGPKALGAPSPAPSPALAPPVVERIAGLLNG